MPRAQGAIPARGGGFVGRQTELGWLGQARARGHRLVTLVGPAGAGKTRLVLEHLLRARSIDHRFVDLSASRTAEDLLLAVSSSLALSLKDGSRALDVVGEALAAISPSVLVLDNFEQLPEAAAHAVERWCSTSVDTMVIVTSRTPLHVSGESCLRIEPLPVPAEGEEDPARIRDAAAVRLFLERAGLEGPLPEIGALVRRLDGLPLAIELCAARAGVLGAQALLEAIEDRFSLLRRPGAPGDRHGSLEAALVWSWQLLPPWEREALAQCAVFAAPFSLGDVTEVVRLAPGTGPKGGRLWAVDVVQALQDRSFLRTIAPDVAGGELRFALYESVRDFVAARRDVDAPRAPALDRRDACVLFRAEQLLDRLEGPEAGRARAGLRLERDGLQAVYDRALGAGRQDAQATRRALRAAIALSEIAFGSGISGSTIERVDRALGRPMARVPGALHATALLCRGRAKLPADLPGAIRDLGQAARRARRARAPDLELRALANLMLGQITAPSLDAAERTLARMGALARRTRSARRRGLYELRRASLHEVRGELERARTHRLAAVECFHALGDAGPEGTALGELGNLAFKAGDLAEARRLWTRSVRLLDAAGEGPAALVYSGNQGLVAQEEGHLDEARQILRAALEGHRRAGVHRATSGVRALIAGVELDAGNPRAALEAFERAAEGLRETGYTRSLCYALAGVIGTRALSGDLAGAEAKAQELEDLIGGYNERAMTDLLALQRLQIELARISQAGAGAAGRASFERVRCRWRELEPSLHGQRAEVRVFCRALVRAIERTARHLDHPDPSLERRIRVGQDAGWLQVDDGPSVRLDRHAVLRRLVEALADSREATPGRSLTVHELFEVGWPAEKARWDAAANRVYATVRRLRRMALGDLLQSDSTGYRLDPRAVIERVALQ